MDHACPPVSPFVAVGRAAGFDGVPRPDFMTQLCEQLLGQARYKHLNLGLRQRGELECRQGTS